MQWCRHIPFRSHRGRCCLVLSDYSNAADRSPDMSDLEMEVGRKFMGYALRVAAGKNGKYVVAKKPLLNFKARLRQVTRRSGGYSMEQVVEKVRHSVLG